MSFNKGYIPWNKGIKCPEISAINNPSCRPEIRLKISNKTKGVKKKISPEVRERVSKLKSERMKKNSYRLGKKHSIETRNKMSSSHPKGELSSNWVKDRTEIISNKNRHWGSYEYTQWRTSVFTRDKFTCRIADINCEGQLQAHHILRWRDYPELRYDINNGITLCHAHHPRKIAEEKRLVSTFVELVSVSK